MSINIDARGLACPEPVIATKKALENLINGVVTILVDNEVAKENVKKFATVHGCGISVTQQGKDFLLRITKGVPEALVAVPKPPSVTSDTVYVITQDTLGHGSRELGLILMKSFMYTVVETRPLPKTVVFMNGGVLLTVQNSPVLSHIGNLAKLGVEILVCGTCIDFYLVKDQVAIGEITNMYAIVETMSTAAKVISF